MKTVVIKDLIKKVVEKVSAKMISQFPGGITFLHGHPIEIIETLNQYNADPVYKDKKYPLIALFQDFRERMNTDVGIYADVSLNIIIANFTLNTYKAPERYDNNFNPILYPIYETLLKEITRSGYFMGYADNISHDKFDRLYWGRDGLYGKEGNIFSDFIDAIEIQNLNLLIDQKICKTWQP